MASSELRAEVSGPAAPNLAASNTGDLPMDAMYEILLRLPAKPLCRFRTVCRFWRSLLSDPQFMAVHEARRPEPLIIAGYNYTSGSEDSGAVKMQRGSFFNIMDLSGQIVKEVLMEGYRVMSTPVGLVCIREIANGSCRLVNPATGATYHVRENLAEEHPPDCDNGMYLFGQVARTGEYKAFRKVTYSHVGDYGFLYEVCTLSRSTPALWRAVQGPSNTFGRGERTSVVIDGVVYFLIADVFLAVRGRNITTIGQD